MALATSRLSQVLDLEENLLLILSAYVLMKSKWTKRKHRWWVHDILRRRKKYGVYHHLVQELFMDPEKFQPYMRLSREQFERILGIIGEDLTKYSSFREVICPKQRLAVCLRYLATGESFRSLGYSYRIGVSTVSKIVSEVCQILWKRFTDENMKMPSTKEEWTLIARNFAEKWQFPHCLGALDGKNVVMKCPTNTGSMYFNYKGTFSTVLMALVDADLKFIAIDVGAYGRNSDGGIFANSNLGKAITRESLNFPNHSPLPAGDNLGSVPYVTIGDEAFPLHRHIMRPYPGRGCSEDQRIFNYRLSRARRIVENAFGVLAARWRVYHTNIAVKPESVIDVVKATCLLHNILQSESTPAIISNLLQEDSVQQLDGFGTLRSIGNRAAGEAVKIRDTFKEYFVNIGPVPWQTVYVNRGHSIKE